MAAQISWSEALMAMLAMIIVLGFVIFYYCIWPMYLGLVRQRERQQELFESDPRWEQAHHFNFSPRMPKDHVNDKKYSRLAACSRTSSMRSSLPGLNAAVAGAEAGVQPPPDYSDLFAETPPSACSPPSYKSGSATPDRHLADGPDVSPPAAQPRAAKKKAKKAGSHRGLAATPANS